MHVGLSEAECRASYLICWPSAGYKGDLQSKSGKDFRTAIIMTKYFKSKKPSAEPFEARVLGRGKATRGCSLSRWRSILLPLCPCCLDE